MASGLVSCLNGTTLTAAARWADDSVFGFATAGWLWERPKKFHLRGDRVLLVSFLAMVAPASFLDREAGGACRESSAESSDMTLVSRLLTDGDVPPVGARTMIGFGRRSCALSGLRSRWADLRKARVDFMARASESLLSDGRRLPRDGACEAERGKAEGHSVFRPSRDDNDT